MSDEDIFNLCALSITCALVGWAICRNYQIGWQGFLWGLMFGPFGVIIALIVSLNKSSRERRERRDLESWTLMQLKRAPVAVQPVNDYKLRIRRGSEVLGQWPLYEVRNYLEQGSLVWEDEYFDRSLNSWVQLSGHPEV